MNTKIQILGVLRFLALPAALLMGWEITSASNLPLGIVLGLAFGVAWWVMVSRGRKRVVAECMMEAIRESLKKEGIEEPVLEFRVSRHGLLARIYVIGEGIYRSKAHRAALQALQKVKLTKYLWVLQTANMATMEEYPEKRRQLNEQLWKQLGGLHK